MQGCRRRAECLPSVTFGELLMIVFRSNYWKVIEIPTHAGGHTDDERDRAREWRKATPAGFDQRNEGYGSGSHSWTGYHGRGKLAAHSARLLAPGCPIGR